MAPEELSPPGSFTPPYRFNNGSTRLVVSVFYEEHGIGQIEIICPTKSYRANEAHMTANKERDMMGDNVEKYIITSDNVSRGQINGLQFGYEPDSNLRVLNAEPHIKYGPRNQRYLVHVVDGLEPVEVGFLRVPSFDRDGVAANKVVMY